MSSELVKLETANNKFLFSSIGARLISWDSFDPKTKKWRAICSADETKKPSDDRYSGSVLFPWCNRLDGDSYLAPSNDGTISKEVPVDKTRNLHGGIPDVTWNVVSVTPASEVVFKYNIIPSDNYPDALSCIIRYQVVGLGPSADDPEAIEDETEEGVTLKDQISQIPSFFSVDEALLPESTKEPVVEGIRIAIEVESLQDREAWVGLGTHLYFRNPFGENIDNVNLSLKAIGEVPVDEDTLIPIHPLEINTAIPLEHDFDGIIPRRIGEAEFDSCFLLDDSVLEEEAEGSALIILEKDNFMLEIIPEFTESKCQKNRGKSAVQFVQVYTPDERDSIAIEPQTCPANHFQHPHDAEYNNNVLKGKGDKLEYSALFIITWSFQ